MTVLRRTLAALWLGLAVATLAVVAVSHVGPALGYRVVIVAGDSMSPSIPIGSLLAEGRPAGSVVAGDVVTMEMPNGAAITHRVTRVVDLDGVTWLETRGDANAEPDPALVPASTVSGVVAFHVPFAGYLLAFLGFPTGVACILSALVALLFAGLLLEARAASALPTLPSMEVPDGRPT
jgi:signal peptidase